MYRHSLKTKPWHCWRRFMMLCVLTPVLFVLIRVVITTVTKQTFKIQQPLYARTATEFAVRKETARKQQPLNTRTATESAVTKEIVRIQQRLNARNATESAVTKETSRTLQNLYARNSTESAVKKETARVLNRTEKLLYARTSIDSSNSELDCTVVQGDNNNQTFIDVAGWTKKPTVGCNGNFYGYGEEFVRLKFARVDSVSGLFAIPCTGGIPRFSFRFGVEGTPLQAWRDNMLTYQESAIKTFEMKETTTMAIMRNEAHNLYHTMCEWYNVFLLSKLICFNPSKVDILFMDARPPGHMDETWTKLFRKVYRYSSVTKNSVFKDLIWNAIGYESPMNHQSLPTLPYIREFKQFYLNAFNVNDTKALDCQRLTVTVLLRRDYMTHPERINMTGGLVHRKFKNEDEIIQETKLIFKDATMSKVILEEMNMEEQVKLISNTDVLIGMHGAGMSHILFLPRHAVVFEMFPKYWPFFQHFKAMARWRNIKYYCWKNEEDRNEFPDYYTHIPTEVVRNHCRLMKQDICGST